MKDADLEFDLHRYTGLLERTPAILSMLFDDLSDEWQLCNEGEATWSPKQVLMHILIEERHNWVHKLLSMVDQTYEAELPNPKERIVVKINALKAISLDEMLSEFEELRIKNVKVIQSVIVDESLLQLRSEHPKLGKFELRELLSIWTAHDWVHLCQISRTIANQFREEVGPWKKNIRIFQ